MRAEDEGKSTTLLSHILKAWGLAGKDELVLKANSTPPPDFAELVPAVLAAADAGDRLAIKVLKQAGAELAELAKIVIARLFPGENTVDVAMYGGVFANCAQVCGVFYNTLCAAYPQANVTAERDRPVIGALELARRPRP
jgi:N-acetylglucosamine kinase-like BadF-type ATPase